MRAFEKKGRRKAPLYAPLAGSAPSAQGIEPRPEIALGTIRLLVAAAGERIDARRIDWNDDGDETCGELPERNQESSLSGSLVPLPLSGERRKGQEGQEGEDDGGTRPGACCCGHGVDLSSG